MDDFDLLLAETLRAQFNMQKKGLSLQELEQAYWQRLEHSKSQPGHRLRLGERITRLYLKGYIENKQGYVLTRKGKRFLETAQHQNLHHE